jgi:hypothetical protein
MADRMNTLENKELVALGELALGNAFYHEYSALVRKYQAAAIGLDVDRFDQRLADMSNPFSIDDGSDAESLRLSVYREGRHVPCHTIAEAIQMKGDDITVDSHPVFTWKDGTGWYFVGDVKQRRIADLSKLQAKAGAEYTFWQEADKAIQLSGSANAVNWHAVEDSTIFESIGRHGQSPQSVGEALCAHSPSAVGKEQQARIWQRIDDLAPELQAAFEAGRDVESPSPDQ